MNYNEQMNDSYRENEMDMPTNWVSNTILKRNANGEIIELEIPDDKDVNNNAANN